MWLIPALRLDVSVKDAGLARDVQYVSTRTACFNLVDSLPGCVKSVHSNMLFLKVVKWYI